MTIGLADFGGAACAGRLDRLLRFDPRVEERYEREYGRERVAVLRRTIVVGLVLYNTYNLTSIALLPDILGLSVALRLLFVTPVSLALAWIVGRVGAPLRELLVLNGIIGAFLIPVFLFWLTDAPLGAYTFGEFSLTLVFGNMVLALRYPHAVAFSAVAFASAVLAAATKQGLDESLRVAFVVQIGTACLFSLYANYRMEARRCRDYLIGLQARLGSEAAESASRQFQDLSRTDALTGLPNRRCLDQTLDRWFADERPAAVMMIDVDHFKLFNDALGHPAGDDCLRSVAAALGGVADRPGALLARFGGEEFTLTVQDVDTLESARIASGLIKAVEALAIVHPGRSDGFGVVTISVGIALKPAGTGAAKADILAAADEALYEAKRRGRHRYVFEERRSGSLARTR